MRGLKEEGACWPQRMWADRLAAEFDEAVASLPSVDLLHNLANEITATNFKQLPVVTEQEIEHIVSVLRCNLLTKRQSSAEKLALFFDSFHESVTETWKDLRPGASIDELRLGLTHHILDQILASNNHSEPEGSTVESLLSSLTRLLATVQDQNLWTDIGLLFFKHGCFFDSEQCFLKAGRDDLASRVTRASMKAMYSEAESSPVDQLYLASPWASLELRRLSVQLAPLFNSWCREYGLRPRADSFSCHMLSSIQIACELANRYDYGVSVAHSGLPLGWACSTLGLDVGIIKTNRQEDRVRLTDFSCLTAPNITGKSVIILEHDMASGATLHSLVKKLAPLEPRKIDVAFNLIQPSQNRGSISQILSRMPQEINEVFIPHSFGASAVLNALEIFSHGLLSQKLDGAKAL